MYTHLIQEVLVVVVCERLITANDTVHVALHQVGHNVDVFEL
jgi:hypothetical protein